MRTGYLHRCLVGVLGHPGDSLQGQWSRSDRLGMLVRDFQPHEDRSTVVDQSRNSGHELAALLILRSESTPTPLVLQFVEVVLRIRAVPVMLRNTEHLVFQ